VAFSNSKRIIKYESVIFIIFLPSLKQNAMALLLMSVFSIESSKYTEEMRVQTEKIFTETPLEVVATQMGYICTSVGVTNVLNSSAYDFMLLYWFINKSTILFGGILLWLSLIILIA